MKTSSRILVVSLLFANFVFAQNAPVSRPKILGVAHIGVRTDDLAAARKFYGDVLGYQRLAGGHVVVQVQSPRAVPWVHSHLSV